MAEYYYKCPLSSDLGKQIKNFFNAAQVAAWKAEEYAKEMGATSYIQPAQYFEGGVDFLEFDAQHEPDLRVWRKRTDLGDTPVYEPDCTVSHGALVMNDTRTDPSNTWRRFYQHKHLTWKEVRNKFPLTYWVDIIGAHPTKDKQKDMEAVEKAMENKFFVMFLDFMPYGKRSIQKKLEKYARLAVKAERKRITLPVVKTEALYALLQPEKEKDDKPRRETTTPTLFLFEDVFYLSVPMPCTADTLAAIDKKEYCEKENAAREKISNV